MACVCRWSALIDCSSFCIDRSSLVLRSKPTFRASSVLVACSVTRKLTSRELFPLVTFALTSSVPVTFRVGFITLPVHVIVLFGSKSNIFSPITGSE